jgi:hypothetical protein
MTEHIKNGLSDVTKTGASLPTVFAVVAVVLGAAYGLWRTESNLGKVETAIMYEQKLDDLRGELTNIKIDNASLRSSALSMAQENGRLQREITRLETQLQMRGR